MPRKGIIHTEGYGRRASNLKPRTSNLALRFLCANKILRKIMHKYVVNIKISPIATEKRY